GGRPPRPVGVFRPHAALVGPGARPLPRRLPVRGASEFRRVGLVPVGAVLPRGRRVGRRAGAVLPHRSAVIVYPAQRLSGKPPLAPVLRGEGSGVRGFAGASRTPSPQPLSPEYGGEGLPG